MTSTQPVHEQAKAYIFEALLQYKNERRNYPDRFRFVESEEEAVAKRIADTLHDAKLLRQPNDVEKIAIAVAEAMVENGFKSGDE